MLGGHAVVAVGYDDFKACLIVRNSWGPSWGDKGYFYLPYDYITPSFAADFWQITRFPLCSQEGAMDVTAPDVKWYIPVTSIVKAIAEVWRRIFGCKP